MEAELHRGFFNIYKPAGMTSRDVVNEVQWHIRNDTGNRKLKLGHTGTLDPLAEGVMVLVMGCATRLTPWMLLHSKRYRGRFRLGQWSESGDLETPVQHDARPLPNQATIESVLPRFLGTIQQRPPAHSAIKIDGQRAHKRLRRGESVTVPMRSVRIDHIAVEAFETPEFVIDVHCGSGTYLRTLGKDIAEAADCTAVMTHLVRTEVGPFSLDKSVSLSSLTSGGSWRDCLLPMEVGLTHLRRAIVSPEDVTRLRNGLSIDVDTPNLAEPSTQPGDAAPHERKDASLNDVLAVCQEGHAVAILRQRRRDEDCAADDRGGKTAARFRPHRVFPPEA